MQVFREDIKARLFEYRLWRIPHDQNLAPLYTSPQDSQTSFRAGTGLLVKDTLGHQSPQHPHYWSTSIAQPIGVFQCK